MNHKARKKWIITPNECPAILRRCPKCGKKTEFINSRKFRVNANGRLIDVWLIYRCKQCETSLNMTIHERVEAGTINPVEYEGFLRNDSCLAEKYGNDKDLFVRNKAETAVSKMEYQVEVMETPFPCSFTDAAEIEMEVPAWFSIRLDALLGQMLSISRSRIKKWCLEETIIINNRPVSPKSKVKDGMLLQIKKEAASMKKD